MENIINELKMQRRRQHLSITEVARRMGAERARVSEVESGKAGLTLNMLYRYADALGLKVNIKFE